MRLPAEWEEQSFIQLTWPHKNSDWAEMLHIVEPVFIAIAKEIALRQRVLIVSPDIDTLYTTLVAGNVNISNVRLVALPTNDTWARDHGAITVLTANGSPMLLDFGFNGWGLKFASHHDNQITVRLHDEGVLTDPLHTVGMILEGGSIESDGKGTILTTAECLLEANRNPHLSREQIESDLQTLFDAKQVLWLESGYLAGDDTDSHIDTLARLAPHNTIVYVRCEDTTDEHYHALNDMENELKAMRTLDGEPYRLLGLPMAKKVYDEEQRLPATYANFLIINGAVLVPTYSDHDKDTKALCIIQEAFPDREIIGIECTPLIYQHGSLHCVTMQYPKGVVLN